MADRGFGETDLREMLESATGYREDVVPGRFVIETTHAGKTWEVVVEPDAAPSLLIVVTAFAID
jgi:hypothetical protein